MEIRRRLPIGAEILRDGTASFRVWAPDAERVELVLENCAGAHAIALEPEPGGYHSLVTDAAGAGTLYRFRLDGGDKYPDPASRYQPEGPHGPSMLIDATGFEWSDAEWRGPDLERPVIYELHFGTFTPEGTYAAAQEKLPLLADVGIDVIELMPVADFPGRFGWGYDNVNLFAPSRLYGMPADLRRFINRAHQLGIAVILDVVYNHLGPDGNYLREFATDYFSPTHVTEWGEALNFYGSGSAPVREFVLSNARLWIEEFHLDGLRIDATQALFDHGPKHIIAKIVEQVRDSANGRRTYVIGENEPQKHFMLEPSEAGGCGLDAVWSDDFHHSTRVAATGRTEAYYSDYRGTAQELISVIRWGFLYMGQYYIWQNQRRGTPVFDLTAERFINFLQNHDQIANSLDGRRLHQLVSAGRMRALTALLLLAPETAMLFQGQEFAASAPFVYFADHSTRIAEQVSEGRREFLAQFQSMPLTHLRTAMPEVNSPAAFNGCKLDWSERAANEQVVNLHRDLIRLSREDPTLQQRDRERMYGAVLNESCFVLRWLVNGPEDRLVIVNVGPDLDYSPAPEPLLAAPLGHEWSLLWSTEQPQYGGLGEPQLETPDGWRIPADSVWLLGPHLASARPNHD